MEKKYEIEVSGITRDFKRLYLKSLWYVEELGKLNKESVRDILSKFIEFEPLTITNERYSAPRVIITTKRESYTLYSTHSDSLIYCDEARNYLTINEIMDLISGRKFSDEIEESREKKLPPTEFSHVTGLRKEIVIESLGFNTKANEMDDTCGYCDLGKLNNKSIMELLKIFASFVPEKEIYEEDFQDTDDLYCPDNEDFPTRLDVYPDKELFMLFPAKAKGKLYCLQTGTDIDVKQAFEMITGEISKHKVRSSSFPADLTALQHFESRPTDVSKIRELNINTNVGYGRGKMIRVGIYKTALCKKLRKWIFSKGECGTASGIFFYIYSGLFMIGLALILSQINTKIGIYLIASSFAFLILSIIGAIVCDYHTYDLGIEWKTNILWHQGWYEHDSGKEKRTFLLPFATCIRRLHVKEIKGNKKINLPFVGRLPTKSRIEKGNYQISVEYSNNKFQDFWGGEFETKYQAQTVVDAANKNLFNLADSKHKKM